MQMATVMGNLTVMGFQWILCLAQEKASHQGLFKNPRESL